MAPIVLKTDVHCYECATKIRDTIKNLLGVEEVWASPETGLVMVSGTADAAVLRRQIRHRMRKPVTIVSDGMDDDFVDYDHHCGMGSEGHSHYYYWGSTTAPRHRHPFAPPPPPCCVYPYGPRGSHSPPLHRYPPMRAGFAYPYGDRYSAMPLPPHRRYGPPPAGYPYPYGAF